MTFQRVSVPNRDCSKPRLFRMPQPFQTATAPNHDCSKPQLFQMPQPFQTATAPNHDCSKPQLFQMPHVLSGAKRLPRITALPFTAREQRGTLPGSHARMLSRPPLLSRFPLSLSLSRSCRRCRLIRLLSPRLFPQGSLPRRRPPVS